MTDSIQQLGSALEVLRRQLSRRSDVAPGARPNTPTALAQQQKHTQGLEQQRLKRVGEQIAAIALEDPAFYRKARRLLLQTILEEEFGGAVANEAGFYVLIDKVESLIEQDARLSKAFSDMCQQLRRLSS